MTAQILDRAQAPQVADLPQLKAAAERHGRRLIDVRTPPKNIPIGTGAKRTGMRLLTVGTDCADFEAGAAEILRPNAAAKHWDVIEGQGSLFHPSYAAVSLDLLHGSQPDVIVRAHDWACPSPIRCVQARLSKISSINVSASRAHSTSRYLKGSKRLGNEYST